MKVSRIVPEHYEPRRIWIIARIISSFDGAEELSGYPLEFSRVEKYKKFCKKFFLLVNICKKEPCPISDSNA